MPKGSDPWVFSGEITRIFARGAAVEGWLLSREMRESAEFEDPEDELMRSIGLETPLGHIYRALPLPRAFIEALLQDKVKAGDVRGRLGPKNEPLFDRTDLL